jgi:hypothetical protein
VVDQKTAALPLPEKVLAAPDLLIAGLTAFFRDSKVLDGTASHHR